MEKYLPVLKKSVLFSGVKEEDIRALLSCVETKVRRYGKGEYVLQQGEYLDDIAVLTEGSLPIQNDDYWGNRSILGRISIGEIFGETYAFSREEPLMNDVVAIEDSTVMFINAKKVISTCSSACRFHTLVVQNLFSVLSEKNKKLVQKLGHIGKRSTREKLISYLSQESKRQKSAEITIPFNRQQLADFLSVDRSAMSNELCKMRDEGLLTFHKNVFRLL